MVCGAPLLQHLIDRLHESTLLDGIVIATSTERTDDPVFEFANNKGVFCHRGSLRDVASRLLGAAEDFGVEHVLRVCGDSPMLDPAIVDQAIRLYNDNEVDLVTNVQVRTFPKGQSVEVFSTELLAAALKKDLGPMEREHVTPYFYGHPETYRILNFVCPISRGDDQLSVDTEADLERFNRIMEYLGPPFSKHGLQDLLSAYEATRL